MDEQKKPSLNEEVRELWGAAAPEITQSLDMLNSVTGPVDLKHRIVNRDFGKRNAQRRFRFGYAGAAICAAALCALLVFRPQQVEQGADPISDDEVAVLTDAFDSDAAVSQLSFDLVPDTDLTSNIDESSTPEEML